MPRRPDDTPFTARMWDTIDECLRLRPPYNPGYFRMALDAAEGHFERRAKQMLREHLHDGLIDLAGHRDPSALGLSMEAVIVNEPQWHAIFDEEERDLCQRRLALAPELTKSPGRGRR